MLSFFSKGHANYSTLANSFSFKNVDGGEIKLQDYKNKVIIVVNVASKCGFTNQYEDLQVIWSKYKSEGLVVIGVPSNNFRQEPGSNQEIKDFCETTFGIDFPIAEKTEVIGKDGKVVDTFDSITKPTSNRFIELIERELKK